MSRYRRRYLRRCVGSDHGWRAAQYVGFVMPELQVNTAQQRAHYRGFTIEASIDGWEWCHKDYSENGIAGICDTIFEAIEAVDAFWEDGE